MPPTSSAFEDELEDELEDEEDVLEVDEDDVDEELLFLLGASCNRTWANNGPCLMSPGLACDAPGYLSKNFLILTLIETKGSWS